VKIRRKSPSNREPGASVQVGGRVAQPCSVVRTRDRVQALATLAALAQISTPSATHFLKSHQLLVQKFAADRDRQRSSFESMGAIAQPCSVVHTRDRVQALATLAALAQISTPSATHFLKSHQLLVQKFAADRDRQRSSFESMGATMRVQTVRTSARWSCAC
jgi:hypothetical protein